MKNHGIRIQEAYLKMSSSVLDCHVCVTWHVDQKGSRHAPQDCLVYCPRPIRRTNDYNPANAFANVNLSGKNGWAGVRWCICESCEGSMLSSFTLLTIINKYAQNVAFIFIYT
jgi:hypothetical protein